MNSILTRFVFVSSSYLFLLAICTFGLTPSILINSILIFYILNQFIRGKLTKHKPYLIFISLSNYLMFQIMVASYAELLEWENILVVLFYAQTLFYYYHSVKQNEKTKLENDYNEHLNNLKFTLFLFVASVYTAQLTFTTLCTPILVLDWFLVAQDCRLIFTNWFSAICSVCGFFSVTTSVVSFLLTISNAKKVFSLTTSKKYSSILVR